LRLLRDAGVAADEHERVWLEEVTRSAIPKVARNEPCPCGSGRKYKVCHLGREVDDVSVGPARALLHKLWLWLEQPSGRRLLHELKLEVVPDSARPERDQDEREAIDGLILDDVILFDRGGLDRFLGVRGVFLPASERQLGRSWLETRRSLYEVRSVRAGTSLTVRDLLSDGAEIELQDRSLSRQVERLDLLCLRLVTDGSGGRTPSSGLLIPRGQRAHLTEIIRSGDPMSLLRWLARPRVMPELANMEGEPLRLVNITFRVPDPGPAAVALGRMLKAEGEGRFVEMVKRDGQDWIRGSISLDGDVATLQTNSVRRADRLARTFMRAAPGSRLIRREERGIEEALESYQEADRDAETAPDDPSIDIASNPDVAAVLDQMMRQHEARWVDEAIPALGGMTPRQAQHDAVMRRELESLLADMEWQLGQARSGATMDPRRIRTLLGMSGRS
ncbi:MAG TPA: SEC-C domain-containing protein, partial [Candidatus Limnocylindrales bacterium]|nr:SEC-C domain-containing protein [Candidatus Limnocylindrales bacterium]